LKRQEIATILISHRLTDVLAVCDRVVALQGRVVSDEPIAQTSMNAVVAHIVGPAWTNLSLGKWRAEG
jgi:ABC-type sugar transport system ATPase subunit